MDSPITPGKGDIIVMPRAEAENYCMLVSFDLIASYNFHDAVEIHLDFVNNTDPRDFSRDLL
jgi:hypothetical protein